jgi:hypothetical protein
LIGTIIISSSITGSLDTGTSKRFSKSISNSSIRGIIRSIFSISIPDCPSCYIIILLLETSLYLLSTILLVVSPTRFIIDTILRQLLLRVSSWSKGKASRDFGTRDNIRDYNLKRVTSRELGDIFREVFIKDLYPALD